MSRGLSKLQLAILEVLESRPDKCAGVGSLSYEVAKRYNESRAFWKLSNIDLSRPEGPLLYRIASSVHRKEELIRNVFSAAFSRALKGLERRGLVQLQRASYDIEYEERDGKICAKLYVVHKGRRPRVKFVVHKESKYFGLDVPQAHRFMDVLRGLSERRKPSWV